MKNFLLITLFFAINLINAQDWSKVYRQVEEVTLNEGLVDQYYEFEKFWGVVKEKQIADGKLVGWFIWKVDPSSNDGNPWAEYLIFNVYKDKQQMDEMNSKSQEWWTNYIRSAHKGKTKRSIVKKYVNETMSNKYRKKSVTYTNKGLSTLLTEGAQPQADIEAVYIGIEQLNEDYVDFETNYFRNSHATTGSRIYWELNEVADRSENAYKPVTHIIFEIPNPDAAEINQDQLSFTDRMMIKYGIASRKWHGAMNVNLMLWQWSN